MKTATKSIASAARRENRGGRADFSFDVEKIRAQFPLLRAKMHGKPIAYLDNAATSQKPEAVLDALDDYYREYNANVHRGIYEISERATAAYERARAAVARFIGGETHETIFTRNATEAINLVARAWGDANVKKGDRIVLTELEHHSNLVPWQLLAQRTGATLEFIRFNLDGELILEDLDPWLDERLKIVSLTQMSNVLGTIPPVAEIARKAHSVGAIVVVDGAQGVAHRATDVHALRCDFLAFSGHKMCGPTGIGVLWGRRELLEKMPPFLGGGEMIAKVQWRESEWNVLPWKFEAGTPSIAEGIGLGAAVEFLERVGMDNIRAHEQRILAYAWARLREIRGLKILGPPPPHRGGLLAFTLDDAHPHDVAAVLDAEGVAIRAGHHCAMPLHCKLGRAATARASFYLYNTMEEVDRLAAALEKAEKFFG